MARKRLSAQSHTRDLRKHANDKQKQLIRLLHRIRQHPRSYVHGKAPKASKNTARMPRKPKKMTKKASGLWDWIKKAHRWVSGKFQQGKKHAVNLAKQAASQVAEDLKKEGRAALSSGKKYVRGRYEHHKERLRNSARAHVSRFAKQLDSRIQGAHSKVNAALGNTDGMPGRTVK